MPLPIGSAAPDFVLSEKRGDRIRSVRLWDHFPRQHVVLLFFPMAFSDVCTKEFCEYSQPRLTFDGAAVYGISGDSPFALDAWAARERITLPLLSDYEHAVARAYGVAYDSFYPAGNLPMGGVAKRSAFVIDRHGTIQHVQSSDDPTQVPSYDAIEEALRHLP